MKKLTLYLLLISFIGCNQPQLSHVDTAKNVVESFYKNENTKLEKHTTTDSYQSFMAIQALVAPGTTQASNFKLIQESVNGDTAWVKFSTSYEDQPEIFKLVKVDKKWKVTEKDKNEKSPF
ncbi:hypothetical protein ACFFU1_11525 [Algibacter miyuki]|uniref:DUF4878 domain-containing protein n=1 Tax=Algibacter miyuki TaxID=1306933 RepID=A0ABV5H0X2_9FLAO|nr:hypothetical protein [Algibacter miyuki]MDN3664070.1 hypothetical protein [Algibacter miyuki]